MEFKKINFHDMTLMVYLYMLVWLPHIIYAEEKEVIISCQHGLLKGTTVPTRDGNVKMYLGIPYATPPVGPLRFKPPEFGQNVRWEGVLEAKNYGASCMQPVHLQDKFPNTWRHKHIHNMEYSEDCLFLNIYVPEEVEAPLDTDHKLPVMVWIHGGFLMVGSSTIYPAENLAAFGKVIVVSFNYRLGLFGFYSTGDGEVNGNMGMLDQVAALVWVHENIASFGGDPERVTIFGESAGGRSVSYHMVSAITGGLFSRAISESGVDLRLAVKDIHNERDANALKEKAATFASEAGCADVYQRDRIECLKSKPAAELIRLTSSMSFTDVIIDHIYLAEQPRQLWDKLAFKNCSYMVGFNSDDGDCGFLWVQPNYDAIAKEGVLEKDIDFHLNSVFQIMNFDYLIGDMKSEFANSLKQVIKQEYFNQPDDPFENLRSVLDLYRDARIVDLTIAAAEAASNKVPVFLYQFAHQPAAWPKMQAIAPDEMGASHCAELDFIFGDVTAVNHDISTISDDIIDSEELLSLQIMELWTSFAETGVPVIKLNDTYTVWEWPRFDSSNLGKQAYVEFDIKCQLPILKYEPYRRERNFWKTVMQKLSAIKHNEKKVKENIEL